MSQTPPTDDAARSADPFTTGDDMLERAKQIAKEIEEKVRKLTSDKSLDPTDEVPPITTESPPLP